MNTAARISLALTVCFVLALSAAGVTHKRTVQEVDFWLAAGCDEVCLHNMAVGPQ